MDKKEDMDVVKTASVESSRTEASRVGEPGAGSERLGGVKAWREAGHASTPRRSRGGQVKMNSLDGLGLKTIDEAGFPVWASKPGASPVWPELRGGGHMAPSRSLRRGEAKL